MADIDDTEIEEIQETLDFWTQKQRELVTASVDYNLSTLQTLTEDGVIDLSPSFQRRNRWDLKRQSKLIESFLINVPIPPIFLNEDELGTYSIIDGKQRLTAITSFLSDRFSLSGLEVFSDVNGRKFSELPRQLQIVLKTRPTIRAVIILKQSDVDVKNEVFQRLNTGGAAANPQEIRNNAYTGPLNNLIMKLAESADFHRALNIKSKESSAIYREMRDAEFVLRFFTFKDDLQSFSGGVRLTMDRYMLAHRKADDAQLRLLEDSFVRALRKARMVFDTHTFQRWQPEKVEWRKQVLAALFDVQMFGFMDFEEIDLLNNKDAIVSAFKDKFEDPIFRKSIDAATNTPSLFKERVNIFQEMVQEIIN
ncbi:DUF262 domain-containing protein [Devosia nitrariae]|nr:DUF262 domain-containing protein [Devosia nitrariae]